MRKAWAWALAVGLLLGAWGWANDLDAVRAAQGAVWNLWAMDGSAMGVICTGTVLTTAKGPRFLSAGHCVADAPKARYWISQSSDPDQLIRVRLEDWRFESTQSWNTGDYSVFALPPGFAGSSLPLCKASPEAGEAVYAWTGPLGMLPVLRTGSYSGELHFPDSPKDEAAIGGLGFAQISGAGGSSGSGMLRLEAGTVCVWGIWVGGFDPRPDGAIVAWLPEGVR